MIAKLRNRIESEKGFTLIELLVVVLIIGILAAIAIPSFLNQRVKGQDACAKSMARTMQTAMETSFTETNTYGAAIGGPTGLSSIENQITGTAPCGTGSSATVGTAADCDSGNGAANDYCVEATSVSTNVFRVTRSTAGAINRTCTVGANAKKGGCNGAVDTAASTGTW